MLVGVENMMLCKDGLDLIPHILETEEALEFFIANGEISPQDADEYRMIFYHVDGDLQEIEP